MPQRYKLTIEYDGTGFSGWQRQKDLPTIETSITMALYEITRRNIAIKATGRTDAGVHAIGQVAHLDIDDDIAHKFNPHKLQCGINHFLEGSAISIVDTQTISQDFHARFSALQRHYRYYIINRYAKLAIYQHKAWLVPTPLNIEAMQQAAQYFIGRHDFTSFRDQQCQAKSPIRTLDKFDIVLKKDFWANEVIEIQVSSRSFLHHQVRNMVGTLYLVGKGVISPMDIVEIIQAMDRAKAGPTAPACGLYLWQIDY